MGAKQPGELFQLFAKFVRAGDIDGAMSLYEKDAASPGEAGNVHAGLDAIGAASKPFAEMKADLICDPRKVVEAGDVALIHNYWSMTGATGHAIEVARRQPDGAWRYIIDDPFADREATR